MDSCSYKGGYIRVVKLHVFSIYNHSVQLNATPWPLL